MDELAKSSKATDEGDDGLASDRNGCHATVHTSVQPLGAPEDQLQDRQQASHGSRQGRDRKGRH